MKYFTSNLITKFIVLITLSVLSIVSSVFADGHVTLRMSTPASATDQRSIALEKIFAPAVSEFAKYEPHYNASLIKQNSELEAIADGKKIRIKEIERMWGIGTPEDLSYYLEHYKG